MLVYAACRRAVAYSTCGGAKGRGQAAAYVREWLKYKVIGDNTVEEYVSKGKAI